MKFKIILFIAILIPGLIATGQESVWKSLNSSNSGLPNESVKCITGDASGNIWVGTYMKGAGVFDGEKWTQYNTGNSGIPHDYVNCITTDQNGHVWIGTDGNGLAKFDGENWEVYNSTNSELPSNVIMDIECLPDGSVWIATYFDGLVKLNGNEWTFFNAENSELLSNKIISLAYDQDGILWVGTHGGGIASYNGVSWRIFNQRNSKLPNDYIYSITVDGQNNKWIGTGGDGIAMYNGIFWENFNSDNSGLIDNNIRPLVLGEDDVIWSGSYFGGLMGFDGFNWHAYNADNSPLPDDEINSLYYAPDSAVWIGTERNGVFVMQDTIVTMLRGAAQIISGEPAPEPETVLLFEPAAVPKTTITTEEEASGEETVNLIDRVFAQNRIFFVFDYAPLHGNKSLESLYMRSFKTLLYEREAVDIDYANSFVVFSSNRNIPPTGFSLTDKQKEIYYAKDVVYLDGATTMEQALSESYDILTSSFVPEGNNQMIAATFSRVRGNENTIRELTTHNLEENYITFSLLSFGPITWKEEQEMKELIPRGGGRYYRIDPVGLLDNWSFTVQFGTSLFRGDMDVTSPVSFPGEFGFAINKKVISTGLLNGGIKGQFNFGEFSGKKREYSFENNYKEFCLNFQVILNSWINRTFKFERVRPYAFGGIGLINYRTLLRTGDGEVVNGYGYDIEGMEQNGASAEDPSKKPGMTELIFPLGGGVNYHLKENLTLEVELSTRYINSDKLDAWTARKDDKYMFFSLGITYKFREKEFLSNILNK